MLLLSCHHCATVFIMSPCYLAVAWLHGVTAWYNCMVWLHGMTAQDGVMWLYDCCKRVMWSDECTWHVPAIVCCWTTAAMIWCDWTAARGIARMSRRDRCPETSTLIWLSYSKKRARERQSFTMSCERRRLGWRRCRWCISSYIDLLSFLFFRGTLGYKALLAATGGNSAKNNHCLRRPPLDGSSSLLFPLFCYFFSFLAVFFFSFFFRFPLHVPFFPFCSLIFLDSHFFSIMFRFLFGHIFIFFPDFSPFFF